MKHLNLAGAWKLRSTDGRYNWDEVQVPGTVLFQIEKSGAYGKVDVFYRENNRQSVEIVSRQFVFERDFQIPKEFIGSDRRVYLECFGLDTLATVELNKKVLGKTNNMHRTWVYPLDPSVTHDKPQHLSILFEDAVKAAADRQKERPLWQVVSPLPGAMHIRKSFCSYGWDWGPQMPDVGIFRDIRVSSYLGAKIKDLQVTQKHEGSQVTLLVTATLDRWANLPTKLQLTLKTPQGEASQWTLEDGKTLEIPVERPQLWWPNGLGEHPLYQISCDLLVNGETTDQRSLRIGLRTLRLERKKDQWGESFQFNINGTPIFACGGNYIPEDVYLTRVTREKTRELVKTAQDANFNCMRVWGGGVYPNQDFFDACDEMGIIIWQDLMFSCAIYDIHNPEFYANITQEVRENLTRIRHHACIGLICGNNEMEWGFEVWGFPHTKENRVEYIKQYEILFPQIVAEVCPYIDYWPASPSSGGFFDEPNHPDRGDVHYWDVWHGRKNYTEFRKHHFRFLSEFGFQGFPNIKTIQSFTEAGDRNIFSPVMEDHQRNDSENGNAKIFNFIADYYRYPKDFESVVYVSQVSQGEALRYAVEHLRQNRGRCMGATYWQFNDNWPVTSWSSVDYYGRWKAMHYVAKRVFAGPLLSIREEGRKAQIHLSNETKTVLVGELTWKLLTLTGRVIKEGQKSVEVAPFHSSLLQDLDFTDDLAKTLVRGHYLSATFKGPQNQILRSTVSFVPYKHLDLVDPKLSWVLEEPTPGSFSLSITAKAFAKFVEIDSQGFDVITSDNYFDLDPGETRILKFSTIKPLKSIQSSSIDLQNLKNSLVIRSLFDTF